MYLMRSDQLSSNLFTKVPSQRRYVRVAEQIISAVSSGDIAPGSRIPSDRNLAEAMGVSRPTVREALMALQFLGIVEVRAGDGAYVVHGGKSGFGVGISLPDGFSLEPGEVIEARLTIEPMVARLAVGRISLDDLTAMEAYVDRAEQMAVDRERLDSFIQLGLGFHSQLAGIVGNRYLASMCASLVDVAEHPLWALVNRQAMHSKEARMVQVREHRAVLERIREGDADGAAEAMGVHLERFENAIGEEGGFRWLKST